MSDTRTVVVKVTFTGNPSGIMEARIETECPDGAEAIVMLTAAIVLNNTASGILDGTAVKLSGEGGN